MFLNSRKSTDQESNCIYPKNDVHFQDAPKNEPKAILIDQIPGKKKPNIQTNNKLLIFLLWGFKVFSARLV